MADIKSVNIAYLINFLIVHCGFVMYVVSFASNNWLETDAGQYGLWRKCPSNSSSCSAIEPASQEGYFEATRTLAVFGLIFAFVCCLSWYLDDSEKDKGLKKTVFRYGHLLSITVTVLLMIIVLIVLGEGYELDPQFSEAELGWCVTLYAVLLVLLVVGSVCRLKYMASSRNLSPAMDCCLPPWCKVCCQNETQPGKLPEVHDSTSSLENGRSRMRPFTIRGGEARVDQVDETGQTAMRAKAKLPPLPLGRRHSKSSDSGMDVSKDSILDDHTGPAPPLSEEMLRRHDRRHSGARGQRRGRRRDERRRRPAFSSTTSLSSTDSQSSAELAPRVHTPTNQKRVHYDTPLESPHGKPDSSSSLTGLPPTEGPGQSGQKDLNRDRDTLDSSSDSSASSSSSGEEDSSSSDESADASPRHSRTPVESSPELAPKVHTPANNKKRVRYDIPPEPTSSSTNSHNVIGDSTKASAELLAAPIISFPVKPQGVELCRAEANAKISATVDNLRLMSSAVKKWKKDTRRLSLEMGLSHIQVPMEALAHSKKKKKEKKRKREPEEEKVKERKRLKGEEKAKEQKSSTGEGEKVKEKKRLTWEEKFKDPKTLECEDKVKEQNASKRQDKVKEKTLKGMDKEKRHKKAKGGEKEKGVEEGKDNKTPGRTRGTPGERQGKGEDRKKPNSKRRLSSSKYKV